MYYNSGTIPFRYTTTLKSAMTWSIQFKRGPPSCYTSILPSTLQRRIIPWHYPLSTPPSMLPTTTTPSPRYPRTSQPLPSDLRKDKAGSSSALLVLVVPRIGDRIIVITARLAGSLYRRATAVAHGGTGAADWQVVVMLELVYRDDERSLGMG